MNLIEIKNKVNKAIDELKDEFRRHPALFYTEGDIVCRLYDLVQEKLVYEKIDDKEGLRHYIVHREYPTPFRCSMKNGFEIKSDGDTSYKRGHYDIVVLNPKFIRESKYRIIKGQNYNSIKEYLKTAPEPAIIYGIEIIFNRDPLNSINNFVTQVEKDYKKLQCSKTLKNEVKFMEQISMLVFDNASSKDIQKKLNDKLKEILSRSTEWCLCFPDRIIK